jgi:HSP20 family molecular chaperone IbpA
VQHFNEDPSKMVSESRVPVTLRDFFFQDPFFKTAWEDFERVREEMMRESREFWSRVDNNMRSLEDGSSSSHLMQQSASNNTSGVTQQPQHTGSGTELAPFSSPWFFPRRWMLPRWFDDSEDFFGSRMRNLDLFQHKDDQIIRMTTDDSKFEISLDTHGYRPDEIKVNVKDNQLTVEAKHEEKSDNRFESRHFSRSYTLPQGCRTDKVHSNLSSDGILLITAPRTPAIKDEGKRNVPIEMK